MTTVSPYTEARMKLGKIGEAGRTPLHIAQWLIKESAYWDRHSSGPVRAPGHSNNVVQGVHGWEVAFGANKFLVERAALRCNYFMLQVLSSAEANQGRIDRLLITEGLSQIVRGAVSNFANEEYPMLWPITQDGHMLFGSNSIYVNGLVSALIERTKVNVLIH